ncbi:MAG: hypothetical protein ACQEQU_09645 [Spirochaetota bacterium]
MKDTLTKTTISLLFLLLLSGAGLWGSSVESLLTTLSERFEHSQEQTEAIGEVFSKAEQQDIPEKMLLPRLQEGIAKQVEPNRILHVLERELEAYVLAREVFHTTMGEGATADLLEEHPAVWTRTATLSLQGFSEAEIIFLVQTFSQLERKNNWNFYRNGSSLYSALLRWGLNERTTRELTSTVAQSRLEGEEYEQILSIIASGSQHRLSPETMAERIIKALPHARSAAELERRVLN